MLKIIFQLVDLNSQFHLLVDLPINLFVKVFKLLVILGVILFEQSFMLLKFDTCLRELLPELFNINCLNAEVAGHSQIRILDIHGPSLGPLRLQLMFDRL